MATTDLLYLGQNALCKKMLSKMGDNYPSPERVILSVKLIKINKKEKEQSRILLLTDKAVYNLKAKKISSCQRRIHYSLIESISISLQTNEFIIHIPEQYDYRFKSKYKDLITCTLQKLCNESRKNYNSNLVEIHPIDWDDMSMIACTKKQARKVSAQERRERLSVYHALMEENQQKNCCMKSIEPQSRYNHENRYNHEKCKPSMSEIHEEIFHKCVESENWNKQVSYTRSSHLSSQSCRLFDNWPIDQVINSFDLINNNDILLVNGYCRYYINSSIIINKIILYLFGINESFDRGQQDIWSDSIFIDDENKTITINDEYIGRTMYGSYVCNMFDNNDYIFRWNLRINNIYQYNGINGSIFIGIDSTDNKHANYTQCFSTCHNCDNYSFGGSKLMGYNLWKKDRVIFMEKEPQCLENGDYILVELDLKRKLLTFVINCDARYEITNINTKIGIKYRLCVYLSNASITLKAFNAIKSSNYKQQQLTTRKSILYTS